MYNNPAKYRYTWPGTDEAFICEDHVDRLRGIANVIGLHLQVILLTKEELMVGLICNQKDSP